MYGIGSCTTEAEKSQDMQWVKREPGEMVFSSHSNTDLRAGRIDAAS